MQKLDFVYQARAGRVVFGAGSLQHLEREVLGLYAERALILCSPEQSETAELEPARPPFSPGQSCTSRLSSHAKHGLWLES